MYKLISITAHYFFFQATEYIQSVQKKVICSENVAYDTVGSTMKMSIQANMTCSKNIAYASVGEVVNNNPLEVTTTSHSAVYDEVPI